MEQQPILSDTPVKVLRNRNGTGNKVILVPLKKKTNTIPNVERAKNIGVMIEKMKEWNRQLTINMKTGGPLIDRTAKMLKSFYIKRSKKEEIEAIKKEVYEEENEEDRYDPSKLKDFQKVIIDTYFSLTDFSKNQFVTDEPDYMLWTAESWDEFKKKVFQDFTTTNFIRCNLDFEMTPAKDGALSKLTKITIKKDDNFVMDQVRKSVYLGDKPALTIPLLSTQWKWKNVAEYKRLNIPGKAIYQAKKKSTSFIYWLPLFLDDSNRKIVPVPYSAKENKFLIDKYEIQNIVAIAPFDLNSNEILIDHIVTEGLFEKSYLCQIIKVIDKTLNALMKEILAKYNLTNFEDYEKKF
jgi:hypothetical protein